MVDSRSLKPRNTKPQRTETIALCSSTKQPSSIKTLGKEMLKTDHFPARHRLEVMGPRYCITIQEWTWDAADRKPSHGSSRYRDEKSGARE